MAKEKINTGDNNPLGENIFAGPVCIILAVITGYVFDYIAIPETNIAVVFLLAVVAISTFIQNYVISLLFSITATLAFNYFFTEPYMAFAIYNVSYIITFVVVVVVSLIISMLTQRIKKSAHEANRRAEENKALYIFTNQLSAVSDISTIARISVQNIGRITDSDVYMVYKDKPDSDTSACVIEYRDGDISERSLIEENTHKTFRDYCREFDSDNSIRKWNVMGSDGILAVIYIPIFSADRLRDTRLRIARVMLDNTAMAMDRYRATEKQNHLLRENEKERYRSNLLRSISHDLRTPLSGIMGTSEMIMDMTDESDRRYKLAQDIREDADWLHSLMENILNLTKLENGQHALKKQPEAIEEIVGVVLERFEKRAPDRELIIKIPDELMLVPMDGKLIVQVLVNLLDNSLKHTTQEQGISLTVSRQGDNACFTVADHGIGIAEYDLPHIFEMYYTSARNTADSHKGMGLGLAICQAVVKAHGGNITAANRQGGGAVFTFTLPMEESADE